jgi:hypothetical protein
MIYVVLYKNIKPYYPVAPHLIEQFVLGETFKGHPLFLHCQQKSKKAAPVDTRRYPDPAYEDILGVAR